MSNFDGALTIVNLLGAPDAPTDGVMDHAVALSGALGRSGHRASVVRCRWDRQGWFSALRDLRGQLRDADRVLLHHTHLGWSRRGFPIGVLPVAAVVGRRRLWVLLHDPSPFPAQGVAGRLRASMQVSVMKILTRLAGRSYSTVDASCVPWTSDRMRRRIALLPVGSNVGVCSLERRDAGRSRAFTVVVFAITENEGNEARTVARVVTKVAEKLGTGIRLVAFGRGVEGARQWLERDAGPGVEILTAGVVSAPRVASFMEEADAQLFLRGPASSRRGTIVAGIAHQVPIVAIAGPDTCWPITEAGIELVPTGDSEAVVGALFRIATDHSRASELRRRNEIAYDRYFSWDRIGRALLDGGLTR